MNYFQIIKQVLMVLINNAEQNVIENNTLKIEIKNY